MKSPFPGMDPYLEDPAIFPGIHHAFITYLREDIQPLLPDRYYADVTVRTWVEIEERFIEPDVGIFRTRGPRNGGRRGGNGRATASATIERRLPIVIHVPHDERSEGQIEIYDRRKKNRVVTVIELLSPSNKSSGQEGRELYLKKQAEVLDSRAALVEIDLLRKGVHMTAVPLDRLKEKVGTYDYHVAVHRPEAFEDYLVYPWLLHEPIPPIRIPLTADDADVEIDLQSLFDRAYQGGAYHKQIDYSEPPPPPRFPAEQTRWIKKQIRNGRARSP